MSKVASGFSFLCLFIFLANAGVPPFLGFFREILSLRVLYIRSFLSLIFLGSYFVIGLYYSVVLVVSTISGKRETLVFGRVDNRVLILLLILFVII